MSSLVKTGNLQLLLCIPLIFCVNLAYAQLPKVGEVQLGATVGVDIPLCKPEDVDRLTQKRDVDMGICAWKLSEYSFKEHHDRYRVLNSANTFFGKAIHVDTYKNRVWRAHFLAGPKYHSKLISLDEYITRVEKAISASTHVAPTIKKTEYSCGGYDESKYCIETIQHTWRTVDTQYVSYQSIKHDAGKLVVELLKLE